ncbi:MAG: DNA-processing protein DprA, partial [Armatimonadetes bacterium]|nr:DNA-processing protein DprA [Armatimonadota bacterium]
FEDSRLFPGDGGQRIAQILLMVHGDRRDRAQRRPGDHVGGVETAAEAGFAIVSGLAHGCDTYGHEGCLEGHGVAVGVLAHGLDRVYPAANRDLAERLLESGGCLVSEYPVGVRPMRAAFAERDRIQSGLSDGVLVIETDVKGGTMHTVRFSRDQGRPLACIDHPEKWLGEEKTMGNQKLIKDGWATPIPDGDALARFLDYITPNLSGETDTRSEAEPEERQKSLKF